ncbi:MAG TPA: SUKH-3 domain-containing protein [Streptomyces sp.]|nr:SUKH-3 domain-containing protein [Streptomyces sp.]
MTPPSEVQPAAGRRPGRDAGAEAMLRVMETVGTVSPLVGPGGGTARWRVFPAAERALRELHGLRVSPVGPGRDCAATGAVVDPVAARHAHRAFGELSEAIGARVFPFGRTDGDSLLAVDEAGRLFAVDHGGWWLLGDSPRSGLEALARGHAPARLERRQWQWHLSRSGDGPVGDALRAAMVAVYVLHHHGVHSARALLVRVTTLRGVGVVAFEERFRLHRSSLEGNAEILGREVSEALGGAGVGLHGAELTVSVLPPPGAVMPLASVDCRISVDGPAAASLSLSLAAGPGASVGTAGESVSAAARAFDAHASGRDGWP